MDLARRDWQFKAPVLRVLPCCLMFLAAGCYDEKSAAPKPSAPVVVVAPAKTETIPLFLELTGRTEAPNTVSVRSRVDGHIESRAFTEGADVSKGDILFGIDQSPYSAALKSSKGEHQKNKASLGFATRESERFTALASDGTVAEELLDQKSTSAAEAQGDLVNSQGAVEAAQVVLDYTSVSAPIDGRIGRVFQDIGNVVSANDTVLVELVQIDPLYVYVSPSEEQFLELEKYRTENPDLKVAITLIDSETHPHAGTLDFINPGLDPETGTIAVRASFPNPERTMLPGQYADVKIQLTEQSGQITVPSEAIGQDQAGFFVFVVDKDNKADLRRVTVGRNFKGQRIVLDGLKENEQVIVQGQQRVRSDMTVQIKAPSATSSTSKASD